MDDILLKYITDEAQKLAYRHHKYHNVVELNYQRNVRRITTPPPKEIKIPPYWLEDKKYNPFYVLKHSKQIAHSIRQKLDDGTYKPAPPYIMDVPKPAGGVRHVCVYQIPDAAVSNYLYHRLLSKNKHRFSSLAYAYRDDRNVHYAIQDIALDFRLYPRLYISEFDFKDFFGSIDHTYLNEQFEKNGFFISTYDQKIIDAFINLNSRGIPQGTSISLFLANLVCWQLDRKLESEGLRFARYADDTVIWSNDYSKIAKSFDLIYEFSSKAGIPINFDKSNGIRLLVRKGTPTEFPSEKVIESIDFLGYELSMDKIRIRQKSIKKIKQQISYLLYRNLIQPLKNPILQAVTVPNNNQDKDFVTAMMQIRRYMYGNLSEFKLKGYLNGKYKKLNFKGIMSFYPLVDDEDQLKELDKWLIGTIYNSIRMRAKLFESHGHNIWGQFPFNLSKDNLIEICRTQPYKQKTGLMEIPSFLRIFEAIQKGLVDNGIDQTVNPKSYYYPF